MTGYWIDFITFQADTIVLLQQILMGMHADHSLACLLNTPFYSQIVLFYMCNIFMSNSFNGCIDVLLTAGTTSNIRLTKKVVFVVVS
uniref:Uncharacterized protein n=1 Tax=Arion vulgaris TaxID=1028688 RepID=A0A0B7B5W1_9EUPU